jgi:hypothetical protein
MSKEIAERNMDLVSMVTRFILRQPTILDHLPQDFRLVILPEDDRDLSQYNLELLNAQDAADKPVVIVRLQASGDLDFEAIPPKVYVPLAAYRELESRHSDNEPHPLHPSCAGEV